MVVVTILISNDGCGSVGGGGPIYLIINKQIIRKNIKSYMDKGAFSSFLQVLNEVIIIDFHYKT